MKKPLAVLAALSAVAGIALAADPPAKAPVELKLSAKAGETFRFLQTEDSSTEVDGTARNANKVTQEYTIKVKEAKADGGLDVEFTFDSIKLKSLMPGGTWTEVDPNAKPAADAGMQVIAMTEILHAMLAAPFTVTLDAKGVPTAVKGLREAVKEGMKSSQYAAIVPLDQMYSDAECVKLVKSLLEPLPAGAREVGTPWTGETQLEVSSQPLDFAAEWTLGAANENDATVTSKFTWKPPAAATAGGATTDGGGTGTTTWSRKDGFVRSMKRHLEANRATKEMKATSHTDVTIERLPAK